MSVSNGQLANQNTFNTYLMSRTVDTDTQGILGVKKTDGISGSHVLNIQRTINSLASMLGITTAEVYNFIYNWPSDMVGSSGDTILDRIVALVDRFEGASGHSHDGTDGEGAQISAVDLLNINQFFGARQKVTQTAASGTTFDVSALFIAKTPGGTSSQVGVVTAPPNNKVYIKDSSTETFIEDVGGQRVYGRITESGGAWTLSFFTNEAGTETAHNLTSTNIDIYFWEVFNLATRPTIPSDPAEFGTLDVTADVADASSTVRGVLNPASLQTLGGDKEWEGEQSFQAAVSFLSDIYLDLFDDTTTSGSNVTLAQQTKMVVRLSNAGLLSIKGQDIVGVESEIRVLLNKTGATITIKHDSDTVNGFMLPGNADFEFKNNVAILIAYNLVDDRWHIVGGGSGSKFVLQTVGATPNNDGATYDPLTGDFNLELADQTNPGLIAHADQILPEGFKKFSDNVAMQFLSDSTTTGSNANIADVQSSIIEFTNGSLVSIRTMVPADVTHSFYKFLINRTGNPITILHDSGIVTNDRFYLPDDNDFTLSDKAGVLCHYNPSSNKWHIISGGGGSAGYVVTDAGNIANNAAITISLTDKMQFIKAAVATYGHVLSTTPFGTTAPADGTVIKLMGKSDALPLVMNYNDATYGAIINGQAVLGNYQMIELIWDNTLQRWIESSRNF